MSYTIHSEDINEEVAEGVYENMTADLIHSDDDILVDIAKDMGYEFKNVDELRDSDNVYEIINSYHPIYNCLHLLQQKPVDDDIKDILTNAPKVSILRRENNWFISLSGCGMDMSDSIAYAYLKIDFQIPYDVIPSQRLTITEQGWGEIQEFLKLKRENRR
jgi:hypothetical protein